jgi:hypothetical protein
MYKNSFGGSMAHCTIAVAAVASALVLAPAAGAAERVELQWRFAETAPGAHTALALHLRYRPADGSDGKASPLTGLVIDAPAGMRLDVGNRPPCTAGDGELRLLGRDACPPASRIGGGALTVDTGFGPPFDPFATEAAIFATPTGFVELAQFPGTNVTLGIDRIDVEGDRLTGHPPATPGGPPDMRTAVREVDFAFDERTFRTPPECPAGGWVARAAATFADGVTATATSSQACEAATALRLEASPRHLRAGRASTVRFRVTGSDGAPVAGAAVRFAGRRSATGADGVARLRVRPKTPGLRRATAVAPARRPASVRVRVLPRPRAAR